MEDLKVSVIIPVYNVENYVERCLESVINQTYKNIEIIIVNDGSTDDSINICKKIADTDKRISIINQENMGLSGARNTGIDKATGEYICFVDSDDWIERDYIQFAVDIMMKNKVKLVVFGYFISNDNQDTITAKGWLNKDEKIVDNKKAMKLLIEDNEINSHAWDKIYHKSLFDEIRFPVGKNFEDIFIMHKIFNKCNKIAISKQPKYHYYERTESIARNYKIKNIMDYFEAEFERRNFVKEFYPNLLGMQNTKLMELLLSYYPKIKVTKKISRRDISSNKKKIKEYQVEINEIFEQQHEEFSEKKFKIMYKLYKNCALVYKMIYPFGNMVFYKLKESKYKEWVKGYFYKNDNFVKEISKYKDKKKIVLIGLPEYDNLGDLAIGYAECSFIQNNKTDDYDFLPVTERCFEKYLKQIKKVINANDIIFIQGGGNFGNQYYDQERIRRKILRNFKENKMYLMPSTFYMKNDKNIDNFVKRYNTKKFSIFLREKYSFELAKKHFKNQLYLVPDIVLSLEHVVTKNSRDGIGLCIRKDIERKVSKEQEDKIKQSVYRNRNKLFMFDTSNKKTNNFEDYQEIMRNIFDEISKYELVITDKLHCMIFCAITGTPCIALGNYNYKIKGVHEWIQHYDFVKFCENINNIDTLIEEQLKITNRKNAINIQDKFNDLRKILK